MRLQGGAELQRIANKLITARVTPHYTITLDWGGGGFGGRRSVEGFDWKVWFWVVCGGGHGLGWWVWFVVVGGVCGGGCGLWW